MRLVALISCGLVSCAVPAIAQNAAPVAPESLPLPERFFPFVIPWDDAAAGTATDVSFLNDAPAGKNGRIIAQGSAFVEKDTGKPIRFWGTGISGPDLFNRSKEEIVKMAAHLAKGGVNVVRLHHLDNPWAARQGGSIWDKTKDARVIDPEKLDLLLFTIAELKKNGIYSNLNLKVSKQLSAADGMPASVAKIPQFQKRVDRFSRPLIEHQKQYARQLLTAENPYTGMRLLEDPTIAFVEINNENSLVCWPARPLASGLSDLPEPFATELRSLWNVYLKRQYKSQGDMEKAWMAGIGYTSENLLSSDAQWRIRNRPGAEAKLVASTAGEADAAPAAEFEITTEGGAERMSQAIIDHLLLKENQVYTLSFEARASDDRLLQITVDRASGDDNVGLDYEAQLKPEWKRFETVFPTKSVQGLSQLTLQLASKPGRVFVRNVRLHAGLPSGQPLFAGTLEAGDVNIPRSPIQAQHRDWVQFITETDRAFTDEMIAFIREDLGSKALLADTQIAWGAATAYYREANSDFVDNHAYWQHPNFHGSGWSTKDWTVGRKSQVNEMARGVGTAIQGVATMQDAARPYTLSEYDHPAPNDYVGEFIPTYAIVGASQGWDALYTFEMGGFGAGAPTDHINAYFAQINHPAKWAFYPTAAMVFRQGLIEPNPQVRTLHLPPQPHQQSPRIHQFWNEVGVQQPALDQARYVVDASLVANAPNQARAKLTVSGEAGAPPFELKSSDAGAWYLTTRPAFIAAGGFVGGQFVPLKGGEIRIGTFEGSYANLTLVSLDSKPLRDSSRALLTLIGRAENPGMGWNADRTSVSDQWGVAPVHAERIAAVFTLPSAGQRKVYVLSPTGARVRETSSTFDGKAIHFTTNPQDQTIWYEIAEN